jgi:hypothetical protein
VYEIKRRIKLTISQSETLGIVIAKRPPIPKMNKISHASSFLKKSITTSPNVWSVFLIMVYKKHGDNSIIELFRENFNK